MRCTALVGFLALASLISFASPVAAAEGKDKGKKEDEQTVPDSAYVKVTLQKGKQKFVHPGFRIGDQEEGVFEIDSGEQMHEVVVGITDVDAEVFRIHVEYLVDGNSQLADDYVVEHGKQAEIGRGETKLSIHLDPRGQQDKSRKDEDKLDEPDQDGDDPLSGI